MRLSSLVRGQAPRIPLLTVVLLLCAYVAGMTTEWAVPAIGQWLPYLAAVAAPALAMASLWRAHARACGPRRRAWLLFTVTMALWCLGVLVDTATRWMGSTAFVLPLADLLSLIALGPLVMGLKALTRPPRGARAWLGYAADTFVCAVAGYCVLWVLVFDPVYRQFGSRPGLLLLNALYPLIDILVLCVAMSFVLSTSRGMRPALVGAFSAVTVLTVSDVSYVVARLNGSFEYGGLTSFGWFAAALVMACVPRLGRESEQAELAGEPPWWPSLVPAFAAGVMVVFLVGRALVIPGEAYAVDPMISVFATTGLLVLLGRLGALVRDNAMLRRELRIGDEYFDSLVESSNDVVVLCDLDGTVRHLSASAQSVYGYLPQELVGRPLADALHPEDLPQVKSSMREFVKAGTSEETARFRCRVRATDGTWRHTESVVSRLPRLRGRDGLLFTARDVTSEVVLRAQVAHLAFHDGLTGLPNRAYFEERTREVFARPGAPANLAAIFLDLDGFTAVNDSVGHAGGDHLLLQAARRLRTAVHPEDTVARFAGDEFAVLVETAGDAQAVVDLAERLVHTLFEDPYQVAGREVVLAASVGVAFASADIVPTELLRNADLAMSRAKQLGGARVEVYATHMHADVMRRLELSGELRRALAGNQFVVEYQPVVDLVTSRVTGVEALVRWWRGSVLVSPDGFLETAEQSGLIVPLGRWVLHEACHQVAQWRCSSWDIGLSVNLSAKQIAAPRFLETVTAALESSGLPAHALTLEVTEEVLVDGADQIVERLSELRGLGVHLAIDDFGTGYASLAYLRQVLVDIIKIDSSFVSGLGREETLTLLTEAIVRLGDDLGLTVVAEGIERPEQLERLREMSCPRGQGYLVARPMAARGVESVLRTNVIPTSSPKIPMSG